MTDVVDVPAPLHQPVNRRRRRLIGAAAAAVVVIAAVISGVWFAHWRSSLQPFVSYPSAGMSIPLAAGHTMYFGSTLVSEQAIRSPNSSGELSLDVSAITPVVRVNTADATISFFRCVLGKGGPPVLAADLTDARLSCSALTPFRAGHVRLGFGPGDEDIVIAVSPKHAGVVRISGVDVRYSAGLRHGGTHTGLQLTTTTH